MLSISNNCQSGIVNKKVLNERKSPSFRSNWTVTEDVFDPKVKQTKNATYFFRDDLNWKEFCKLILANHEKDEKLNIVCVPCSDGSEPTSLLLKLMQFKEFRNNLSNFDCIKAYDIDDKQLEIAKSGKIPLLIDSIGIDFLSIFLNARKDMGKTYNLNNGYLELADDLKDKISYEKKDIVDVVENLPKDEKVVLLARNVFPYLDDLTQIPKLLDGLSQLKEGSILAIGDYDKNLSAPEGSILKAGYKKAPVENCYIKI